jgi:hypothetical protein
MPPIRMKSRWLQLTTQASPTDRGSEWSNRCRGEDARHRDQRSHARTERRFRVSRWSDHRGIRRSPSGGTSGRASGSVAYVVALIGAGTRCVRNPPKRQPAGLATALISRAAAPRPWPAALRVTSSANSSTSDLAAGRVKPWRRWSSSWSGPPWAGQIDSNELTRELGFRRMEAHCQAPRPQHRVQATSRAGVSCRRDPARARRAPRHLPQQYEAGSLRSNGFSAGRRWSWSF